LNKINNINKESSGGLFNNLRKVVSGTGLSRIFGLIRDISTTNLLGASIFHDIFVICLKIPNLFRRFFAEGAFNQAFIPIYSDYEKENNLDSTFEFLNSLAGILITTLFIFTLIVLIFAPIFIFIFAPGFYFDPVKKDLAINVLRIMFPYLALISLVAFAGGIQNTHKRFSIPAYTPVFFNLSLIIAAVAIAPKYEMPIYVLAWGVLLAGIVQLLIQILPLWRINRLPIPRLNFNNTGIKKFFRLIVPAVLAGGIIQINLLIDTIFASLLETGSPTWLYISDRLIQFPMGIFAIAIGTVLLPTLSKFDLNHEKDKFIAGIQKGQKFVLYIGLPSLIGLFFCAEDLISTIFYRGAFTSMDVINSSYSLMAFSFGLPFFMLMKVLTPAFFARKDTKTPMYVALVSLFLNVVFNYYLAFVLDYGHVGIAIGSSLAAIISVLTLEIVLYRDGFIKSTSVVNKFSLNVFISSLFLIIFLYFYTSEINFMQLTQVERIFYLSIEVFASVFIYFSISRLMLNKPLRFLFN
jgi:putative peptidoglycan lipid II flippase